MCSSLESAKCICIRDAHIPFSQRSVFRGLRVGYCGEPVFPLAPTPLHR